tara:strand:+ start:967 stop:1176 length:210 start_codon:yes stop_codon:yes gene_type:complete
MYFFIFQTLTCQLYVFSAAKMKVFCMITCYVNYDVFCKKMNLKTTDYMIIFPNQNYCPGNNSKESLWSG